MSWNVLFAASVGYAVGNAPDHSAAWLAVKVVFTALLLFLVVRLARREAA